MEIPLRIIPMSFDLSKIVIKKDAAVAKDESSSLAVTILVLDTGAFDKKFLNIVKKGIVGYLPSIVKNSIQTHIISCNNIISSVKSTDEIRRFQPWIEKIQIENIADFRKILMYVKNICEKCVFKYTDSIQFKIIFFMDVSRPCSKKREFQNITQQFSTYLKKYDSAVNMITPLLAKQKFYKLFVGNENNVSARKFAYLSLAKSGKIPGQIKTASSEIEIFIYINEVLGIDGYTEKQFTIICTYLIIFFLKSIKRSKTSEEIPAKLEFAALCRFASLQKLLNVIQIFCDEKGNYKLMEHLLPVINDKSIWSAKSMYLNMIKKFFDFLTIIDIKIVLEVMSENNGIITEEIKVLFGNLNFVSQSLQGQNN